jgi:hypothetical protein
MIEVGDLVRIKNKYLRASGESALDGLFSRIRKWKYKNRTKADGSPKPWRYRGKQRIAKVVRIISHTYEWRYKKWNTIVELDLPDPLMGGRNKIISTDYLAVHRKGHKGPVHHSNDFVPYSPTLEEITAQYLADGIGTL